MNEIIIMIISMVMCFLVGSLGMLMLGNKTTWNYFKVKLSRGRKILIFLKTKFGWQTIVVKREEQMLIWTYDKIPHRTTIEDETLEIHKYGAITFGFINLVNPMVLLRSSDKDMLPAEFDSKVYANLMERCVTAPRIDEDKLNTMLIIVIVICIISLFMNGFTMIKIQEIGKQLLSMKLATTI